MPADLLTVEVHPAGLLPNDLLLSDPDVPGQEVEWRIGAVGKEHRGGRDLIVADYTTEDGTEGRHGFEDPDVWLTVVARSLQGEAA